MESQEDSIYNEYATDRAKLRNKDRLAKVDSITFPVIYRIYISISLVWNENTGREELS